MWKAIRLHPWRLEIVPAAAFGLAVWSACVYETRVAWMVRRIPELRHSGLEVLPVFAVGAVVFQWLIEFGHNQSWVQSERRKRFNGYVLVMQGGVITWGWFAYAFADTFSQMTHRFIPPVIPVPLLFAMLAGGAAITALLEWSRKYVPREEPPEPPLPPEALYSGSYSEIAMDWWHLSSSLILLIFTLTLFALAVAAPVLGGPREAGLVAWMASASCAVAIVATLGRNMLVVTPSAVTHCLGFFRIRLPIADMESCVLGDREPGRRPRGVKMTSRRKRGSRFVEITMKNGRVYRLGAIRPTHICAMAEQARKDLPPAPSAAEGGVAES